MVPFNLKYEIIARFIGTKVHWHWQMWVMVASSVCSDGAPGPAWPTLPWPSATRTPWISPGPWPWPARGTGPVCCSGRPGPARSAAAPQSGSGSVSESTHSWCQFEQIPLFHPRGWAAQLRGFTPIATLERFAVYCSCEDYIVRAPGRGPEGTGNCSSCYLSTSPECHRNWQSWLGLVQVFVATGPWLVSLTPGQGLRVGLALARTWLSRSPLSYKNHLFQVTRLSGFTGKINGFLARSVHCRTAWAAACRASAVGLELAHRRDTKTDFVVIGRPDSDVPAAAAQATARAYQRCPVLVPRASSTAGN